MMDELTPFEQREAKCNLIFRIAEVVVCSICLIIIVTLIVLCSLLTYVLVPIAIIAALTTLIVVGSIIVMIRLRNRKNTYHKHWLFIALASMICYFICVALLVIQQSVELLSLFFTAMGFAILAAVIFLLDFIYNLRNLIIRRKNKTRKNQVMPENTVAVEISEEKLAPNNEVCGTIECSVIVGDQLACNQQLCHVKWSGDKASTPTAKLIYVQPCNSSVINKICPACKNYNCDKCFHKEKSEADITPATESQSVVKSTQFPEKDEPICPLCTFKAVKVYKTEYVQTSEEAIPDDPVLKRISENLVTRNYSIKTPLRSENELRSEYEVIESSPVTPSKTLEEVMVCSKCQKGNIFMRKLKKSHVCPMCNQECRSKLTCTTCYNTVFATSTKEESKKSMVMEKPLRSENEVIESSPVTPRNTVEELMVCSKCQKGNIFMRKLQKSHVCPMCNQECRSKLTCTTCYNTVSAMPIEEETKKSTSIQTNVSPAKERRKSPYISPQDSRSPELFSPVNEMTQVSPEDFEEEPFDKKRYEDKMIQVSSKECNKEKHHKCCVCDKKESSSKIEMREIETQVSLIEFMEGYPGHFESSRRNYEEYKGTNISSKELVAEMATLREISAEKIYENKSFGDQNSVHESVGNEATQVTDTDFPEKESSKVNELTQVPSEEYGWKEIQSPPISPKIDELTQVSSSDFVQKERRPCGAPNCQHPMCTKYNKTENVQETRQVMPEEKTFEKLVQTEQEKTTTTQGTSTTTVTPAASAVRGLTAAIATTTINQFREIACQPGQSLEEINAETISSKHERNQMENDEIIECIDSNCTCVINEKEILVCIYCQSMLNKSMQKPTTTIDEVTCKISQTDIPSKTDCKCNLSECICCKKVPTQVQIPKNECFCIKTDKGLLKCTICEILCQEKDDKQNTEEAADLPICSSSVSTCFLYKGRKQEPDKNQKLHITQVENTESSTRKIRYMEHIKRVRQHRKDSEDEEQKNKSLKTSEKNENDVKEDDYASSISDTCSNDSENNLLDSKYLTVTEVKTLCKKEREKMSRYLIEKDAERSSSALSPDTPTNVTVFTLQNRFENIESNVKKAKMEDDSNVADDDDDDDNDNIQEKMKSEWEALVDKHAAYQSRMRKDFESQIKFDDDSKEMLEKTESKMQTIYNSMIKNLLERQSQKENNLILLERLKCGCDSDAEFSKHQESELSGRKEEETSKNENDDDDILLDMKERNIVTLSSSSSSSSSEVIIMSENVSLSTITEEVSGTPSDLISSSKESKQSISKEQLEKKHDQVGLNETYCIKMTKTIDGQQEVKKNCNQSCKRDALFVYKLQGDRKEVKITPRNTVQSARCPNISAKSCSTRSEKCPRKSAGFFEPFLISPTKTSLTTSDYESTSDLLPQDNIKTVSSSTGSSISFHFQEDPIPKEKSSQSQSVPLTSRSRTCKDINKQDVQKVFYYGHSIPCTPKKIHWQDTKSNSLMDDSETSTKKVGKDTYESDDDEDNETVSMIVMKKNYPETDGNEFEMQPNIMRPLLTGNRTPDHSESKESRPASCGSHFSASTLQTIDKYNLEYSSSLNKNPKYIRLQEIKQSRKSPLETKSQSLTTRAHTTAEKLTARKNEVKLSKESKQSTFKDSCKLQEDKTEAENTPSCSTRSEKLPRKSAGFFEPFLFSPMYGSTKTSLTTSDNESTIDLIPQDNIKTVRSNTSSHASFHLQDDPIPKEKSSQSVPTTSRSRTSTDINKQDVQKVYYYGHNIPYTPTKLHWQDTRSNSLSDVSETSTKERGKETYRKEPDYDEGNETASMIVIKNFYPETDREEFEMQPKIVLPLLAVNITPEHSESEESRPISCSSHLSARTLQTIDNYNLEYNTSLNKNPKCMRIQEIKQTRKSILGTKSKSLSTRSHTSKKLIERKHEVKFNLVPEIRERHVSAPPRTSYQRKKVLLSPKLTKGKSSSPRTNRQKPSTSASNPYKSMEKGHKGLKKSKLKSTPVSPERDHCKIQDVGAHQKIQSAPATHRSNLSGSVSSVGSSKKKGANTPKSAKQTKPMTPNTSVALKEKPKTSMKSDETSAKSDDT